MQLIDILNWIPRERLAPISISSPAFIYTCLPSVLLTLLSMSRSWANLVDRPLTFAIIYAIPFFSIGFGESWGDAVQWSESINARYFMSEPGATWIHHWAYKFLHEYLNMGVQDSIGLTSRVAGFVFLFFAALLSRELLADSTAQRRLVFRCIYFASGIAVLFYGYVENTPLALPAELIWVVSSVLYFKNPSTLRLVSMAGAIAVATLIHGRVSFYAPVFALACVSPSAPLLMRLRRALIGGSLYVSLIAIAVIYIQVYDARYLIGGPWGNITGGGNRQMFTATKDLLSSQHWWSRSMALFVAGGLLSPIGLIGLLARLRRITDPFSGWLVAYCLTSLMFVFLWEFDYGPAGDWDLVFSAASPFILLTAISISPSQIPVAVTSLICSGTAIISLFFGSIVNGRPFQLTVPPTASLPLPSSVCIRPGLERMYFTDRELSQTLGSAEVDIPHREWANDRTPLPTGGRPFGARYRGYVHIPTAGRYRIPIMAQGNVRLVVGEKVLFERWYDLEVRVTIEREISFPAAGWYPINIEFFTTVQNVPLKVSLESNKTPLHPLSIDEVCS